MNAVTYLDMAVRGRPSSSTPEEAAEASAHRVGIDIPGDESEKGNRLQGLGPLMGIATGVAAGVVTALTRRWRPRTGLSITSLVAGITAMVGADVPMAALGVSNPREWSVGDWLADIVPHLGYGVVTAAVLEAAQ